MFFFFKQKTAYEMRISDWSSDLCSSDLFRVDRLLFGGRQMAVQRRHRHPDRWCDLAGGHARCQELSRGLDPLGRHDLLAPTYPACATRDDERGRRSLAHEVAFHLGHRSHDVKDELPRRRSEEHTSELQSL